MNQRRQWIKKSEIINDIVGDAGLALSSPLRFRSSTVASASVSAMRSEDVIRRRQCTFRPSSTCEGPEVLTIINFSRPRKHV